MVCLRVGYYLRVGYGGQYSSDECFHDMKCPSPHPPPSHCPVIVVVFIVIMKEEERMCLA